MRFADSSSFVIYCATSLFFTRISCERTSRSARSDPRCQRRRPNVGLVFEQLLQVELRLLQLLVAKSGRLGQIVIGRDQDPIPIQEL